MRKRLMLAVLPAMLLPAAATAQGMSVQTFLTKVDALKKKGMMALFSPDVKLIKAELQRTDKELKAEKKQREAAGKPPLTCPPKDAKMDGEAFLSALQAIPPAERATMSIKTGVMRVAMAKYPCRKG